MRGDIAMYSDKLSKRNLKKPDWIKKWIKRSFYLIHFHPKGGPEAFIYCVIQAEA